MEIKGHLDEINEERVWGWALAVNNPDPVEVHLYVNARQVSSCNTTIFRKEILEKGIHPTGKCGFSFALDELGLETIPSPLGHHILSVTVGPDHVPLKRILIYEKSNVEPQFKPKVDSFFFVHIPKTAGTALRFQLDHNFRKEEVYTNRQVIREFNGMYPGYSTYLEHAIGAQPLPRFWVGHVPFILYRYLSPHVRTLTMMRDPVERVISALIYLQKKHRDYKGMALQEIFEQNKRTRFFNLQCRYFADTHINKLTYFEKKKPMDGEGLEQAKQNLSECDFVGLQEHFDASLSYLSQQYGFSFTERRQINQTPGKSKVKIPSHILEEIPSLVEYDQQLYDFARELFDKQVKEKK